MALLTGERGGASSSWSTKVVGGVVAGESRTDRSWLTLEAISALLTTLERATLLLELGHGDGWESRSGVVLSLVVVNLVDRDGGVDNRWLDSLLLDDWLDVLVNVCRGSVVSR